VSGAVLVDEFLPVYDVSDEVAAVVDADAQTTWDALMDVDLIEVGRRRPLVALLGAARILPDLVWQRLHGEHPPAAPERLTLRDTTKLPMGDGGWVLLGERPPEEIALGLVGKFWRPVIEFAEVEASAFRDWGDPGFAKTIYALGTAAFRTSGRCCGRRCAPRPPTGMPAAGSGATGPSASAPALTCWSTACWTWFARTPSVAPALPLATESPDSRAATHRPLVGRADRRAYRPRNALARNASTRAAYCAGCELRPAVCPVSGRYHRLALRPIRPR
jgi:hypothetical protein